MYSTLHPSGLKPSPVFVYLPIFWQWLLFLDITCLKIQWPTFGLNWFCHSQTLPNTMVFVVSKLSLKVVTAIALLLFIQSLGDWVQRALPIHCRSIAVQWPLLLPIIYAHFSASWAQKPAGLRRQRWPPCAGWNHKISPGQWVLRRSMCQLQIRALNCHETSTRAFFPYDTETSYMPHSDCLGVRV